MAGKVVKQLAGSGTGQSFMDRMNAAKHSLSGSGLGKSVCKATTEEIAAPKRKHLEYLIQCTNEPNVSIPELADHLISRCHSTSWVTAFKALVTVHNLMNLGNERFSQYLASNNCQLDLPNFTDKTTVQAYDMSLFIRHYSKYVSEKAESYRMMAFDFCKVKRGKDDGVLRTMTADKLLKALPILQKQLDVLLEFEASTSELANQVINAAFILLYKDLIRLFASYNEGMINLIEKYFNMNKKQCKDALGLYKNFVNRMDKVNSFLKTAETMGIGDKESLGLQPVPSSVLEALEQHLAMMEGRKYVKSSDEQQSSPSKSANTTTTSSPSKATASSPGFVADFGSPSKTLVDNFDTDVVMDEANKISEMERQQIIAEEKLRLADFAAKSNAAVLRTSPSHEEYGFSALNMPAPATATVSSGSSSSTVRIQQKPLVSKVIATASMEVTPPAQQPQQAIGSHLARDQFGPAKQETPKATAAVSKPSDDLLLLGFDADPTPTMSNSSGWPAADFATGFGSSPVMPHAPAHSNALDDILGLDLDMGMMSTNTSSSSTNLHHQGPVLAPTLRPISPSIATSGSGGGSTQHLPMGFDPFQSLLQPNNSPATAHTAVQPAYRSMGNSLAAGGGSAGGGASPGSAKKPFGAGSNLDETLASLAGSLSLGGGGAAGNSAAGNNKWSSPGGTAAKPSSPMTGSANRPGSTSINWGNNTGAAPMSQTGCMHTYNPFVTPLMFPGGVVSGTTMSYSSPTPAWYNHPPASAAATSFPSSNAAWNPQTPQPVNSNNPFLSSQFQSASFMPSKSGTDSNVNDPFGALL